MSDVVTLWAIACQASLSMRFSKQEYWSGLPCPSLGDLPDPGIKPTSLCLPHWQVGSLPLAPPGKPSETTKRENENHSVGSSSETSWTVACQAPLSREFSRQEYWSGLPFPPPEDLPDPGVKPESLASPAWAGGFFATSPI